MIFDLDGTLLDSLADLAESMNAVLNSLGVPPHAVEAYRYFVGDGIEKLAARVLPVQNREAENVARCVAGMRREYGRRWHEKSRPYPGIEELLASLAARRVRMAILSNKPHDFTREIVAHFFARHSFALVLGAQEDLPVKPDPRGALRIATALALAPDDLLYLGDTDTDMRTATAAGMHAVGVLWGFRSAKELAASGACLTISHPRQLLAQFAFGEK